MAAKKKQRKQQSGKVARNTGSKQQDPITLLKSDHAKVKSLFADFRKAKKRGAASKEKAALVDTICRELKIHTQIEENIFYPAVREAIDDEDLMDEALVEHAGAKELIAQLEDADPADDLYDAKVTVLGEQIDHHVEEEEGEMFKAARKADLDMDALGAEMASMKAELTAAAGGATDDGD